MKKRWKAAMLAAIIVIGAVAFGWCLREAPKGNIIEVDSGDRIYWLDDYSGRLRESIGGVTRELGSIDLSSLREWTIQEVAVEQTPGGNYLVRIEAWVSGAISLTGQYCCWLNGETGESCAVFDSKFLGTYLQGEAYWLEYADGSRELCLVGDATFFLDDESGATFFVDDEAGEVKQRFDRGDYRWADGRWLLQGWGGRWELIDRLDGSRRDLAPILLSAENKVKMDDMVRPYLNYFGPEDFDERVRALFWGNIDNEMSIEPKAHIEFLGEENGVLHFELQAVFMEVVGQSDEDYVIPVDIAI